MSKKTLSQMEAVLTDRINQAKNKLDKLQQKHKLEIGSLAYKHGLQNFTTQQLDYAFARIAKEINHGYQ
ncbi:hypothetical protein SCO85_12045 [Legionella pneumophila serogroup 1]|uniref:hypothetical protein n=1 Tax=Legionella pneumophila TaxID=446 RepID=UPI001A21F07F|nr:hypothetical protein [Legionella pneumophila]MCH9108506.1 hypothetical protein [Legionella pneumophila serogroup 1]MCH9115254.1 hypothetical protein [Legionella pneumophila serogroup 1]MDW8895613.1 hypothetical protein [Legionella pneumophila]MDW9033733.1 hypothetical protein [Legionella pneumophila]MDW9048719.1 hypothetical protein [Legionella pneumophila]